MAMVGSSLRLRLAVSRVLVLGVIPMVAMGSPINAEPLHAAASSEGAQAAGALNVGIDDPLLVDCGANRYLYVPEIVGWRDALERASEYIHTGKYGHLATIESLAENDCLYEAFLREGSFARSLVSAEEAPAWIALTDENEEGIWRWAAGPEAGSVSPFLPWASFEPNNDRGVEHYVVLHWLVRTGSTGSWFDYREAGVAGQSFIVEFQGPFPPRCLFCNGFEVGGFGPELQRDF